MALLRILTVCTAFIFCFGFTDGAQLQINVDRSNPSSFSTVQAAIDSVPSNNSNWITISVKAGTYTEQVKISADKQFIYMKGEAGQTFIVWGSSISIADSATFDSMADNILVTGITFVNSYNYPPSNNKNPVKPAVAAKISGDKSSFYRCGFLGYQDTLYDLGGRHYFNNCNITGAVDFIFGNGQSLYEWCSLSVNLAERDSAFIGYVTAQGRDDPNDGSGFVFKNCDVVGNGSVYLGRAWRSHSRVIFSDSFLSNVVVPQGWDAWDYADQEADGLIFAEERCRGIGSDKSKRVTWERNLSQVELNSLTAISYIDNQGWISTQPPH